jgi:hypothetical protein
MLVTVLSGFVVIAKLNVFLAKPLFPTQARFSLYFYLSKTLPPLLKMTVKPDFQDLCHCEVKRFLTKTLFPTQARFTLYFYLSGTLPPLLKMRAEPGFQGRAEGPGS